MKKQNDDNNTAKWVKELENLKATNEPIPPEVLAWLEKNVRQTDLPVKVSEDEGKKIVGNILKHLRKKIGITQQEMAGRLDYDKAQFISLTERGASKIPTDKIRNFVTAYEADEMFHPAIMKLTYQNLWEDTLKMIAMAGADSFQFDDQVEYWISKNQV